VHTLPDLDGEPCRAFAITTKKDEVLDSSLFTLHSSFIPLRASYDVLPLSHYLMAGKARELVHFDDTVRFCSVCGSPMQWNTNISKVCTACQREVWPSIATAIIVLITRGDEILLVRARNFRRSYYGLVAGFLETGETLEECVRREVKEETNLEVKNICYFGNQPWPYPSGQMIGFTAEYAGGELCVQDEELTAAAFFRYDCLPEIPHKLSMARMLIDAWLEGFDKKER
jgi:NAD+ diphosphatase